MTSEELQGFIKLDEAGFLPAPGESAADFACRVDRVLQVHREFITHLAEVKRGKVFDNLEVAWDNRIPSAIVNEAAGLTRKLYDFEMHHVPGFFLSQAIGLLWGGCMIGDLDNGFSIFLIRNHFRTKTKWLFYRRDELLAHELCHSMRQVLCDVDCEEHFAYQTSYSWLRRHFGNCFIKDRDAILFVLPTFVLLAVQLCRTLWLPELPIWPFWIGVALWPLHLICRNQKARFAIRRAQNKLRQFGIERALPILFRCTTDEIKNIGQLTDIAAWQNFVQEHEVQEFRWKIIAARFIHRAPEQ